MPVISVVVPAYNVEQTILETLQSIQQQTFVDLEIIVINDGSTDRTLELLSTIEDQRLKVFSYENGGLPVARNRGISRSNGQFIAFIDADDLWTPDKLALQLEALQRNPQAGVAYSWTIFIDDEGKFLYAGESLFHEGDVYPQLLVKNFIASGSNILVRRNVIEEVGEFDSQLKSAEDWDYSLRLAARYPFALVPKHQILYRKSSQSMTAKVDVMEKAILIVIDRGFQAAPEDLQFLKNRTLSNTYRFFTKLCLEHISSKDGVVKARQKLQKSIQLYPKSLLKLETQRLLLKLLFNMLFPRKTANSLIRFFGKQFPMFSIQDTKLN
ncbi:glycosyltransferase [Lyngbya aestuarii]|uniref:glycosyltransferase n=1 Tax=Lyngbya aestuarii TaxID=118322 RepID=UPI00403E20BD